MDDNVKKRFVDFYKTQSDAIFRFCLVRTGDREVAIDLSQEAFLKYWNVSKNEEIENGRALIFRIARNLVIDWYRKNKPTSLDQMMGEGGELEFVDIPDGDWENENDQIEGRFALSVLKNLPHQYREIIGLRFVEGMKPQEIAEVLSLTANSVSVRLNRALDALRKELKIVNK